MKKSTLAPIEINEAIHKKLRRESKRTGKTMAAIRREILESWAKK